MNLSKYYKILGTTKEISDKELKNVYRQLALKYHPDLNNSVEAEEKFKEISFAYAVLSSRGKPELEKILKQDIYTEKNYNNIIQHSDVNYILKHLGLQFSGFQRHWFKTLRNCLSYDLFLTETQMQKGEKYVIEIKRDKIKYKPLNSVNIPLNFKPSTKILTIPPKIKNNSVLRLPITEKGKTSVIYFLIHIKE